MIGTRMFGTQMQAELDPGVLENVVLGLNACRGSPLNWQGNLRTPRLLIVLREHGECRGRGRRAHGGAITAFDK